MNDEFVITRVRRQFRVVYGYYRTACKSFEPAELQKTLKALDLNPRDPKRLDQLRHAAERYLLLEQRAIEKFGPWTSFRIWRVDHSTLQVDFDGTYTELNTKAKSDRELKACLHRLGANELLLDDLQRGLKAFRQREGKKLG
ncbi:MAG TPA: hypothetical protein PLN21_13575 [Gemmatales bacterium]|nr:hypothetical protein [Gemmatales bacterium]